jgi:hypothetical protein
MVEPKLHIQINKLTNKIVDFMKLERLKFKILFMPIYIIKNTLKLLQ